MTADDFDLFAASAGVGVLVGLLILYACRLI